MIGYVKKITRFGIFILFDNQNDMVIGLLRWSDVPKSERFYKNKVVNVVIKEKYDNGKLDLVLVTQDFQEIYEKILIKTAETLQKLRVDNQKF
jgi:RecJ-like exonuclease